MSNNHNHDDKGWADKKGFRNAFLGVLIVACIAAALAGFVGAWHNPHPHFKAEEFPVFFALWGFGSFAFIVLAGQHLRKLVGRKEDYYDERE
jgi:MFS family permease